MVDEIGQFAALIDFFARTHDGFGQWSRATTEHADFADIAVFLLYELQKGSHVRTSEMVNCLQTGEHAPLGYALEVVLADVEHCCTQIELVEELRDKDMHLQDVGHVLPLHITQHVDEPFKMTVRRASP